MEMCNMFQMRRKGTELFCHIGQSGSHADPKQIGYTGSPASASVSITPTDLHPVITSKREAIEQILIDLYDDKKIGP